MKKLNGKAIAAGVGGLGLLAVSLFGLLKKDEEVTDGETIYDNNDDFEVVDDETDN